MRNNQHRRGRMRTGTVIIGVLACMVVCSAMISVGLQSALRARREARLAHQRVQVQLLNEAGVRRAITSLERDEQYRGEKWQPKLDLSTYSLAEVEIVSTPQPEHEEMVDVQVTSRLDAVTHNFGPLQRTYRFQYTKSSK